MKFFERIKTKRRIRRGELIEYDFVPDINDAPHLILEFSTDPKRVLIPTRDVYRFVDEIVEFRRKHEKS